MPKTCAIILASGSGLRFQNNQPKQFMKLAGMPVLAHTIKVFQTSTDIDEIVVVCHDSYIDVVWDLAANYSFSKISKVICGGDTRQESSYIGISCCNNADYVLIHDSVRPFLSHDVINDLVSAVQIHNAVDTVIPSADTLVEVDKEGFILDIPERSRFRRGQTPQAFSRELILGAHQFALGEGVENVTDDCQLMLNQGHSVFCVKGSEQNIKITYPIDLHIADKLFQLNSQKVLSGQNDFFDHFRDRVAVIFGGTDGIGASLSRLLLTHGCKVYCCSRHSSPSVDVTCPETIDEFLCYVEKEENNIDFVINCAGDLIRKDVEFTTLEEWRYLYQVNVEGSFNVAQKLIPLFRRQRGGVLVFLGSSSYTRGRAGYSAYSSSKAALVNFCQALAEELAPLNAKVNIVNPGRVRTALRERNFGKEPEGSLLCPDFVALKVARILLVETTGSVFDIV